MPAGPDGKASVPGALPFQWADLDDVFADRLAATIADLTEQGWPAVPYEGRRTEERGQALLEAGRSQLGPRSHHVEPSGQVTAADVIHATDGWGNPAFFDALAIAAERNGLVSGHRWKFKDSAHVELPS